MIIGKNENWNVRLETYRLNNLDIFIDESLT